MSTIRPFGKIIFTAGGAGDVTLMVWISNGSGVRLWISIGSGVRHYICSSFDFEVLPLVVILTVRVTSGCDALIAFATCELVTRRSRRLFLIFTLGCDWQRFFGGDNSEKNRFLHSVFPSLNFCTDARYTPKWFGDRRGYVRLLIGEIIDVSK